MNEPANELDPDLRDAQLSALYRQLPPEEPSADIDQALRAAARRAVHAAPGKSGRAGQRHIWQRHTAWLASAAMLALCVGLVVQMQRQLPEPRTALPPATPAASAPAAEHAAPAALADAAAPASVGTKQMARSRAPAIAPAAPDAAMVAAAPAPADIVAAAPAPKAGIADNAGNVSGKLSAGRVDKDAGQNIEPAADYRQAMMDANVVLARRQLAAATANHATAAQRLDSDLLQQLQQSQQSRTPPACAGQSNGDQQPLCDLLALHAAGKSLPADWRQQLDAAGLWQGAFAYRHALLERLLSGQPD